MRKWRLWSLLLLAFLTLPGVSPEGLTAETGKDAKSAEMNDRQFYTIAEEYLDETLRINPAQATLAGYHKYDGEMEDLRPEGIRAAVKSYENFRKRFAEVDPGGLSVSARIDHGLLTNDVEWNLFQARELRPHENDPSLYNDIIGFGSLFLTILDEGSPHWPARLESLRFRMEKIPAFLEQAKRNLKNPSPVLTEFIIEQNPGNVGFFEADLPPLFARAPAIHDWLAEANAKAVRALKDYQAWLETDLRPRSRGDWRLGKDLWTKKLRYTLQSDMAPTEILERASERLREQRQRMLEVARPLHARMFPAHEHGETGDDLLNAVVGEVIAEVSKRHSRPETLFDDTRRWVEKIKGFIRQKDLIALPPETDNFVIEPTPGFLNGLAVAFFMPPPAFEPDLKKSFWISSVPSTGDPEKDRERQESYLREYNDYGLQSLSIHEAFPGHYVQLHHALNSPYATIYKKVFASGTFAEGWAVLAEEQMFQNGYGEDDPANLLIHLKINLRTPMNAILDARMHTEAMSDEETDRFALDLMRKMGFQEEAEARGKLRRAKVTSTQLSTYFVGYLELRRIYDEHRERLGGRFDLKAFNAKVLSYGTIPPRAVRTLLREEMGEKRAAAAPGG
ncbi:MAG: DUF885 domain-containing protein [Acidobacteria bacterium]|nr:DUF885 domain-containing protein [Acidobacteriota bacterium]